MSLAKLDLQTLPQLKSYWICNWFLKKDESSKVRCARDRNVHRAENTSTQTCRCAKAESCLRNMCVYIIYELNVWIKRCYCSVCDCAACKLIWKCEKLIDLLHHICLYVRKSWVVPLQYMCICCIWAQHVNKALLLLCVWLRCM